MESAFIKKTKIISGMLLAFALLAVFSGCSKKPKSFYANPSSWAYAETDLKNKKADVFFICPTVYLGTSENLAWDEFDPQTAKSFVGAINMQKGIYDDQARFYAPFYHQAALSAYYAEDQKKARIFAAAFREVEEAFTYYMKNFNKGRPIILAGFSQGADMCIRLMKHHSHEKKFRKQLVACYAIGWRFTPEEQQKFPYIKTAKGETDTGVLVLFNSEAESVDDSIFIPNGTKSFSINPLNWKTDSTPAFRFQNLGACFTNYREEIMTEIPGLTGAYIDNKRGALKVPDISPEDFPAVLFDQGIFHIYDYQFFYRNLEKNVQDRIQAYLSR